MPKIPIAVKQNIKKNPQNVFLKIASFSEIPPIAIPFLVFLGLFFDPLEIIFHGRKETKISNTILGQMQTSSPCPSCQGSGKIINKDDLERRKKNGPETLLIHGDADEVVPVSNILEAKDFLIRNNVSVNTKIIKNCGHHIPIEASSLALHFIKKNLEIK